MEEGTMEARDMVEGSSDIHVVEVMEEVLMFWVSTCYLNKYKKN